MQTLFVDTNIGYEAVNEAADAGNKVWAMGVNMDQSLTVPKYASVILTSMIKRVDIATYDVAKEVSKNTFQGGKIVEFVLKEDGVGIAATSSNNVPKDVLDLVQKYSDAIKSGKLVITAKKGEATNFYDPTDIK